MSWYDAIFAAPGQGASINPLPAGGTPGVARVTSPANTGLANPNFLTLIGMNAAPAANSTPGGGSGAPLANTPAPGGFMSALASLASVVPHLDLGATSSATASTGTVNIAANGSAAGQSMPWGLLLVGALGYVIWKKVK